MTKDEVFEKLKGILKVVRPDSNLDGVDYNTRLVEDLALDSLSMLLVGLAVENELGVRFSSDIEFKTVEDICLHAQELLAGK